MPTVTESDLKELKDLIMYLKVNQANISGQITALDEKIAGLVKRLDFQEFVNRDFLIGVGVAI